MKDTVAAMKIIKDSKCDALGVAANVETCFAAVQRYSREYGLVFRSKDRAYDISGGDASTKNRTQRDARVNAVNIRDGILDGGKYFRGANTTLKPRFTDKGAFEVSCYTPAEGSGSTAKAATTVYGATAVKTCMDNYKLANTINKRAPQVANSATAPVIKCNVGNLASGLAKDGLTDYTKAVVADACAQKDLANGLVQYVDDLVVTCDGVAVGAVTPKLKSGKNCFFDPVQGKWLDRSRFQSYDGELFRSVGKTVKAGTSTTGDILEGDIKCLNTAKTAIVEGTKNCWAYEITSQKLWNEPQYLWLAQPTCPGVAGAAAGTGIANCKQTNKPCTAADAALFVKTFNGQICVPTFTWVKK